MDLVVNNAGADIPEPFLEFESGSQAREFYDSMDYQEVIGYRSDSAHCHLYILECAEHGDASVR